MALGKRLTGQMRRAVHSNEINIGLNMVKNSEEQVEKGSEPIVFKGARVIFPHGIETVCVRLEDGLIQGLDMPQNGARVIDASGLILAPAMVDIHGDAFERQLMPRPGVAIPVQSALLETDRQLAANGIATAFHALTLGWEPGLRSVAMGWQIFEGLQTLEPRLTVQHRLQLRWETFCAEAIPLIEAALGATPLPSLAFNDHTSVALLHPSIAVQNKPFDFDPDFPLVDFDDPHFLAKVEGRAKRSNLTTTEFVSLMKQVWTQRPQVQGWIEQVAEKARVAGASMLSHDDTQTKTRAFYRALGAKIAEFPMNVPTSTFARDGGDAIIQGAPNAMRGGSHLGSVSAAEMIKAGLCDILASDYYYPAMLGAVMRLLEDKVGPLHTIWKLVSENPARASGLGDRGQISLGQRGDLVLLDWPDGGIACVRQTWVAGRCAYAASPV